MMTHLRHVWRACSKIHSPGIARKRQSTKLPFCPDRARWSILHTSTRNSKTDSMRAIQSSCRSRRTKRRPLRTTPNPQWSAQHFMEHQHDCPCFVASASTADRNVHREGNEERSGIMSGRQRLGELSTSSAAPRGIYAPRDSILLPPARPIFEPFEFAKAPINKFELFQNALLILVTSAAFLMGTFIALFVQI